MNHDRARARDERNLLRGGRSDRPLNERVATLEFLMEIMMADQDTLDQVMDAIANDVALVSSKQAEQLDEIQQLHAQAQAGQPVDLSGYIAKAENIKAMLDNIAGAASGASSSGTATDIGATTGSDTSTSTTDTGTTSTADTGTSTATDTGAADTGTAAAGSDTTATDATAGDAGTAPADVTTTDTTTAQ